MPGVTGREILTIKTIRHSNGTTQLTFESGWKYTYKRRSVTLNANTVKATHGETVKETLGSGNGASAHQSFTLKKPPLTYTSASTPSGGESSLELRVDNILWEESASLYGLTRRDEKYTVRIEDGGSANVLFGDGISGARLPTGEYNVTAVYRSGTGLDRAGGRRLADPAQDASAWREGCDQSSGGYRSGGPRIDGQRADECPAHCPHTRPDRLTAGLRRLCSYLLRDRKSPGNRSVER